MRIWLLFVISLLPSIGWSGPPVAYQAEIAHSAAWFEVGYWPRSKVKGRFSLYKGSVELDERGKSGRGEILFDMNSVQTGSEMVNDFVKSRQIFDTANYPVMSFRPSRFEYQGERLLASEGELLLHGVSRVVRLDVKRFVCADSLAQVWVAPQTAEAALNPAKGSPATGSPAATPASSPTVSPAAAPTVEPIPVVLQAMPGLGRAFCHGEFTTTVIRSQFGMTSLSLMVDDEVKISVSLILQKVAP